ncbi:hypothetical protein C1H46_033999 [Malus baccata]|uniref:Uncharacterized protein n=1 Tax=Malus baccata TaxID=106549 RepID=A0A540L267_MALBA|nr:hypothetical protein C1H46_033999 [Malus baccata]
MLSSPPQSKVWAMKVMEEKRVLHLRDSCFVFHSKVHSIFFLRDYIHTTQITCPTFF